MSDYQPVYHRDGCTGLIVDQRGNSPSPCPEGDPACTRQGCPEHPSHHAGDHTYEQHHAKRDHVGSGACRCDVYRSASHAPVPETAQAAARDVQAAQGWTETTLLDVLLDYIEENNCAGLREYLEER